jgi:hypothetical protein
MCTVLLPSGVKPSAVKNKYNDNNNKNKRQFSVND